MGRRWLLVVAAALLGCGHAGYPPSAPHPLFAHPLPDLRGRRGVGGETVDASAFAGKVVVVKFFADYCEPCKATLPAAERVHAAHPDVVFLGVDEDEDPSAATALVQRYALTFPVVHDAGSALSGRFRVSTMPATFVADRASVIRWVGGEGQTEDDMRRAVEAAAR